MLDIEKPRERLEKYGKEAVSLEELIAIILKTGNKEKSVKEVSKEVLTKINKIEDLKDLSISSLTCIKGIGNIKAIELIAAIELGRRVYKSNLREKIKIKSPNDVFNYCSNITNNLKKEHFYVMYLDNKKNILEFKLLFVGGINACIIDIREIFKYAYLLNSASFICIHNHPSGEVVPSKMDDEYTKRIYEVSKLQGIPMEDHIIIGSNNYYSYKENCNFIY